MPSANARELKPQRSAWRRAMLALAAIVLLCAVALAVFHEALLDKYLKRKIIASVQNAHPIYTLSIDTLRYNMFHGRFDCSGVTMSAADSSVVCDVEALSIDGVGIISLILGNPLSRENAGGIFVDARDLHTVYADARYELRINQVTASGPDATIEVDSLSWRPTLEDSLFFASPQSQQSRYRLSLPRIAVSGIDAGGIATGERLIASAIVLESPELDILLNRDVESTPDTSVRRGPQEGLAALEQELRIDSVRVRSGTLRYAEKIDWYSDAGVLTFDRVEARALKIMSRPDSADTMLLSAAAMFMNAGEMAAELAVPLQSAGYTLHANGSIGAMDLTQLNGYLEAAELKRVKAGDLYSASFDFNAHSGTASGTFHAVYDNLDVQHLEGRNVVRELAIYMFHKFKLRKHNVADHGKEPEVGVVAYSRKPTDRFIRFIWLSIRSGLGDLLGFH